MPLGRTWLTVAEVTYGRPCMYEVSKNGFRFWQLKKGILVTLTLQWPEFITAVQKSIRYWRCVHYVYKRTTLPSLLMMNVLLCFFMARGWRPPHSWQGRCRPFPPPRPRTSSRPISSSTCNNKRRVSSSKCGWSQSVLMIYGGPGFLAVSLCVSPVQLTDGRGGGRGWGFSQIIRPPASLVLYKSSNTL